MRAIRVDDEMTPVSIKKVGVIGWARWATRHRMVAARAGFVGADNQ